MKLNRKKKDERFKKKLHKVRLNIILRTRNKQVNSQKKNLNIFKYPKKGEINRTKPKQTKQKMMKTKRKRSPKKMIDKSK